MALAALPQVVQDWFNANRPGPTPVPGTWYTGLVSDLAVGDYLHGPRASVTATGATTSGVRALTLVRHTTGQSMSVNWVATSSLIIRR